MFTESAEFYDAIYSFKDYVAEADQIVARVRSVRPGARTVLDVACGTGEHVRLLADRHGFDVDGLDFDPGLLRVARTKHPLGRFFEADMSSFVLERRYDAILCLFSSIAYLVTLERVTQARDGSARARPVYARRDGWCLREGWPQRAPRSCWFDRTGALGCH